MAEILREYPHEGVVCPWCGARMTLRRWEPRKGVFVCERMPLEHSAHLEIERPPDFEQPAREPQ